MTIERVVTASGSSRVTGVGYAPTGRVESEGAEVAPGPLREEQIVVLGGGSLAGDARLYQAPGGEWLIQGDPTEAAFLVAERKMGTYDLRKHRFERVAEVPFTSERKMLSTIECDHAHEDQLAHRVLATAGQPALLVK